MCEGAGRMACWGDQCREAAGFVANGSSKPRVPANELRCLGWCFVKLCAWFVLRGAALRCLVKIDGARWCSALLGGVWWCYVVLSGAFWCLVVLGGAGGAWWCMAVLCV